ncbi:MAG: hypothetical protein H6810_00815 [Phycisphaeraceae bacterium]|nr:MAG: hypothetical protein H6810_00815 [Phycisphaeraceae bacterium]
MHNKFIAAITILAGINVASAQQVYTGLDVEFSKVAFADPNLAENQDRITDNVWITRGDTEGIFNLAAEPTFTGHGSSSPSPIGTEWAVGSAADWQTLTFGTWGSLPGSPPSLPGVDLVMHLVDDDIYIDVRFTDWGGGGSGGAFTYLRSSVPSPCNAADLAEPLGILDLSDIQAFISAFVSGDPAADLAPPAGILDLSDIQAFIGAFVAGCP